MVQRYRMTIAYLGTRYHGWQFQDNARTIQGEMERVLRKALREPALRIEASGRTDAGVHAAAQVIHVDISADIPPASLAKLLNARLVDDIRVRSVSKARPGFHARYNVRAKRYCYRIRWQDAPVLSPWVTQRHALLPRIGSTDYLREAIDLLEGRHDFASFTVSRPTVRTTERNLVRIRFQKFKTGLRLDFLGEGFLRYQVRRMVGALFMLGQGKMDLQQLELMLKEPEPGASLFQAPARGLCLERVWYRALK